MSVPERHFGIAAAEELVFVGVGAIWYFAAIEDNRLDWDIESVRQRFSRESVRYDSNNFLINFVLHPLSGAAYYGFPRSNGLTVQAAFGYAVVATLLWEFGLEFNERLSVNDLVTTPLGGMAIGEFFHRFGRYLNSAPGGGSAWHKAFGYTLGINQAFHDRVLDDRRGSRAGTTTDALGYDAAIAHRFIVDYGVALARTTENARFVRHELRILAELVAIPGFLRPGRFAHFYGEGNFTRLSVRGLGGPDGSGTELYADTVFAGYFAQNVRDTEHGPHGFGVSIGSGLGYLYRREKHASFEDLLGITHLPGLALDTHALFGRVAWRGRVRLHGDFVGMRPAAYDDWRAANSGVHTRPVLQREGYYFGWGYSARVETELELPYLTLGASVFYGRYASDEGLDRDQERIDAEGVDVSGTERVLDTEAFARVRPVAAWPLHVELAAARRQRDSRLEGFAHRDRFERVTLRVGVTF
jgi:hypothetical protein